MASPMTPDMTSTDTFARRFLPVWMLGLIGVASLALHVPPAAVMDQAPQLRDWPVAAVRALVVINPLVLLTLAAIAGAALAHRVDLHTGLRPRPDARRGRGLGLAAALGLLLGLAIAAADALLANSLGPRWAQAVAQATQAAPLPALMLGLLYGGLAEEVMLRWGLMSLVVWAMSRALRSSHPQDRAGVAAAWSGIGLSALAFALAHLPAVAQLAPLDGPLVVRTLVLNAIAGVLYGWLFWRRNLLCAMMAHATTHVGMACARALI